MTLWRWTLASVALAAAACSSTNANLAPSPPPARAAAASPAWWNGAVVYEVFVRSFRDANGDGKGDLDGLVEKLDYLNDGDPGTDADLGVDAIWLMPIFASPSYHGYDTTDYEAVNPDYGTLAAFDRLVAEAHRRGIKVILDLVVNHTSSSHPWFQDAASSQTAPRRDWYVWSATDPGWTQPWGGSGRTWHPRSGAYYYGVFWSGMPDLNYRNPEVRAEMKRLAGLWLGRGADGFRLDAARHIVEDGGGDLQVDRPDTHAWWKELAASVRASHPEAVLAGESWTTADRIAPYFGSTAVVPWGDELPLLFDFPLADAILQGAWTGDAGGIARAIDDAARLYPPGSGDAPFLANHDQVRLATQLGGDPGRLRLAAALLLTMQGTPFLYYGEEIGMENGACSADQCKRTPMAWDGTPTRGFTSGTPWWPPAPATATAHVAAQAGDPASLLSRYRTLIRLRKGSPALRRGGTQRLATDVPSVLAFLREDPAETVLVAHNLGTAAVSQTLAAPGTAADALFADPGATASAAKGGWTVALPPQGSGVWRVR
jgi:glycosidase